MGDKLSGGIFHGNVASPALGFCFQRADLVDRLIQLRARARAQGELGAFACVMQSDCLADASAAAGDDRDFVFEFHGEILECF